VGRRPGRARPGLAARAADRRVGRAVFRRRGDRSGVRRRMTFPASPAALDAAWIEDALRRGGASTSARVRRVSAEVIGAAYGWVSTIARVTLDGDGVPASVVAK